MTKIEASVVIDRPVEDVWKFVTYPPNFAKWDKGVIEARQTSAGSLGVGATLDAKTQEFGTLEMRVVEYEPNRKFAYEFSKGPSKGTVSTFSMENVEGKSRQTLTFDLRVVGFYRLLRPFVERRMRSRVGDNLSNLKRVLESEAKP